MIVTHIIVMMHFDAYVYKYGYDAYNYAYLCYCAYYCDDAY